MSVSTFVCAGSLYTGNEMEKCLFVFRLFFHLSLQWMYEMGLVYNDTFVLNLDCVYGEIEPSISSLSGQCVTGEDNTFQE